MQMAISCAEFLLFKEERIVEQGQGIEDVEVELRSRCQLGVVLLEQRDAYLLS